ncbi:MAG: M23 family metallopeptidase [Leptospiraceae bacterium]|nr:M23 family metallopeptidase [Leptospiraceae bacterium]MDW7976958.1 M23 family metallopeptidase [Leptospiraceae bacterium]
MKERKETSKRKQSLKKKNSKEATQDVEKISYYLGLEITPKKRESLKDFLEKIKAFFYKIHRKGLQKLTIMFIPHSESSILNFHINFYTLFAIFLGVFLVGSTSVMMLVYRSSQNLQYYDMGVTSSQFYLQSARLAEEILPMHNQILQFAETIAKMHSNLRISRKKGEGGFSYDVTLEQIEYLKYLIQECKQKKEECDQKTIEEILKISLNISNLDNEILKETNTQLEEILQKLQSEEIQHFFSFIPTGLPVKGFISNNYGSKVILDRGNHYPLRGVEIFTLPRAPVYATAKGKITEIKYHPVFGLSIWIEHLPGIKSFFAHLDEVIVQPNQIVNKGDVIAYSGKSGKTLRNMIYYEVHIGTLAFNPHILMNDLQTLWMKLHKP